MSALSRRYLSVWLRRLSTDRIERRFVAPADAPLAIVAPVKSALRLTGLNDAAAQLGLKTGMALADARAMYPTLAVADADTQADRRALEAIADWCDRYTPLVGLDPPDGLKLDVAGCAHLFGGEAALCRNLVGRLAAQGFQARAAIADTFGAAWAVARCGTPGVVPKDAAREALLPLPVSALRLTPEVVASLAQSGLKQIADLIARPRAPLAARFGQELIWRLDQALGRDAESIVPRLPLPSAMVERRFADPIALEEDVLGTIEQLARNLEGVLERRGEGARLLQVALFRADGKVHRLEVGTGAPVRDSIRIRRLFAGRCLRPWLRLRHGAALGAGDRALRSGAEWFRRARSEHRACTFDRSSGCALRIAPRAAADRTGHTYSGIRRRGTAGACGGAVFTSPLVGEVGARSAPGGGSSNEITIRHPPPTPPLPHKSLRPGARKRGPGGGGSRKRHYSGLARARTPHPAVCAAGIDRSHGGSAGRPAGAVPLAAGSA
jgi:nucleotidyltransferase/DNA polymerase involved in DNA repair